MLPVPVECGGEESLVADPNWWEAVLVDLSTPAMSRTSVAADPGLEWDPVTAASAAWPEFRQIKSLSAYYMYLMTSLDSWRVEWPCMRSSLGPNCSTRKVGPESFHCS